jgi:hypothetical protein
MSGLGTALLIASLEAEAKKLDKMGDRLQRIILQSPNMSEEAKAKVTQMAAQRQKAASEIRILISQHK